MQLTKEQQILQLKDGSVQQIKDQVIKEFQAAVVVNGQEIAVLACSPMQLEELAVGYLAAEGFIDGQEEIKTIDRDGDQIQVVLTTELSVPQLEKQGTPVVTSSCGNSILYTDLEEVDLTKVEAEELQVEAEQIHEIMDCLYRSAELFQQTGGVHSALLTDSSHGETVFREDIGRHNAVDKLVGHLIIHQLAAADKILAVSGRISAEILLKVARQQIPVLVSRSAPTDRAIRLACRLGITLVGFVRGKRMNIYTDCGRIAY